MMRKNFVSSFSIFQDFENASYSLKEGFETYTFTIIKINDFRFSDRRFLYLTNLLL